MIAAVITNGQILIKNTNPNLLESFINILSKSGVKVALKEDSILVEPSGQPSAMNLETEEFPGFPTDMQAQIMALACVANGTSFIRENIFENRFMHVPELNRLGADIKINGNCATIKGNKSLIGAQVMATDLRASVSLVLAGLAAKGETVVNRIYHLDRGYENLEKKLASCGANIYRIGKNK